MLRTQGSALRGGERSTSVNGPASVDAVQMWVVYDAAATSSARFATTASATACSSRTSPTPPPPTGRRQGLPQRCLGQQFVALGRAPFQRAHRMLGCVVWLCSFAAAHYLAPASRTPGVNLRLAGTTLPANRAVAGVWPVALATANYGGATDLGGQGVVLPSDVNAASFGIEFASKYTQTAGNDWTYVDGVALEVTYCAHP
ncbi:MAG: hypothetical protein R3B13_26805 [Polyangiaceae bacterium]